MRLNKSIIYRRIIKISKHKKSIVYRGIISYLQGYLELYLTGYPPTIAHIRHIFFRNFSTSSHLHEFERYQIRCYIKEWMSNPKRVHSFGDKCMIKKKDTHSRKRRKSCIYTTCNQD